MLVYMYGPPKVGKSRRIHQWMHWCYRYLVEVQDITFFDWRFADCLEGRMTRDLIEPQVLFLDEIDTRPYTDDSDQLLHHIVSCRTETDWRLTVTVGHDPWEKLSMNPYEEIAWLAVGNEPDVEMRISQRSRTDEWAEVVAKLMKSANYKPI